MALPNLFSPAGFALLAECTIKATVILGSTALLALLLRQASAARRHLLWACALGAIALMPALLAVLPAWRVAPPAMAWVAPARDATPVVPSTPAIADPAAAAAPDEAATPGDDDATLPSTAALAPATSATPGTAAATRSAPVTAPARRLDWREIALLVWAIGALLVLGTFAAGHFVLRLLLRDARPVRDGEWHALAIEAADRLHLTAPFALLQGRGVPVPVAFGLLRPRVLLPPEADEWPLERRRSVLLHELAHVQRHDCLTQAVAQVACALLWFHPVVWWAAARLRVEREQACDDRVLAARTPASDYADHLLDVVRSLRATRLAALGAVAFARKSSLEGRLLAVLDPRRDRRAVTAGLVVPAAAFAALLVLPFAALEPVREQANASTALAATTVRGNLMRSHRVLEPNELRPSKMVPVPAGPLAQGLAWASADAAKAQERSWWVGWRVARKGDHRGGLLNDSEGIDLDMLSKRGLFTLDDVLLGRGEGLFQKDGARQDDNEGLFPTAMLVRMENSGARRVRVQTVNMPADFAGEPFYWLDSVEDEELFEWLKGEADRTQEPRLRARLIESVGFVDRADLVTPWLGKILDGDEGSQVRRNAAEALGQHPSDATLRLLTRHARTDRSSEVRRASVEALGRFQTPEALDALMALAGGAGVSNETKRQVFDELGQKVVREAPNAETLSDEDAKWARKAARAAKAEKYEKSDKADEKRWQSTMDEERSVPMSAGDQEVQRQAIESLGRYPEGKALPRLKDIAESSPDGDLRAAAVEAIGRIGTPGAMAVVHEVLWKNRIERARHQAVEMTRRALPAEQAIDELAEVARSHPSLDTRRMAVEEIGRIDSPRSMGVLEQVIAGDYDPDSQRQAVESLGRREGEGVNRRLIEIAHTNDNEMVRRQAVESLGRRGGKDAADRMFALAREDGHDEVQRQAVESLGRLADPRVKGMLLDLAKHHPSTDVERQAVESLGRLEDDTMDELADIARTHPSGEVRRQAVESMTRRDPDKALPILESILKGSAKKNGI